MTLECCPELPCGDGDVTVGELLCAAGRRVPVRLEGVMSPVGGAEEPSTNVRSFGFSLCGEDVKKARRTEGSQER